MAFTDLAEHLEETLGYGAGVFDRWSIEKIAPTSARMRHTQPGYSYRDVPRFAKKTDSVSTAEIATWRKRMPPRGVRFDDSLPKTLTELRLAGVQTTDLDELRALLRLARSAKYRGGPPRINARLRLALGRAA